MRPRTPAPWHNPIAQPPNAREPVSRSTATQMIQTGLAVGEIRFARQAALAWLSAYPGDLYVGLLHARALFQELRQAEGEPLSPALQSTATSHRRSEYERLISILQTICQADPEYLPAQEMLARALFISRTGLQSVPGVGADFKSAPTPGPRRGVTHTMDTPTLRRADIDTFGDVLALEGSLQPGMPVAEWSYGLRQARQAMVAHHQQTMGTIVQAGKATAHALPHHNPGEEELRAWETAESLVHRVLLANPSTPLAAVTHLQWEARRELPLPAMRSLASVYHERWPGCVQFTLMLAGAWMDSGEEEQAVAYLHQAVAKDVTGQVARRLWGEAHPYRSLWPETLEAPILQDLPIPAGVASALGWNQLPAGLPASGPTPEIVKADEKSAGASARGNPLPGSSIPSVSPLSKSPSDSPLSPAPISSLAATRPGPQAPGPEVPLSIQSELERVAARLRQPQLGRADGRYPVYVIFTTRRGLQNQYGAEGAARIEEGMLRLAEAAQPRRGWNALLFYADEGLALPGPGSLAALRNDPARCEAARYNDPWSLKLVLADLDAALGKRGEMIGAVLIVGGPEVVPFHHLPNPVDDADADVASDNPYATRDENYFIPEWPVGRLPGGIGPDPSLLLEALDSFASRHRREARTKPWIVRWWEELRQAWQPGPRRMRPSLGYTAAVWKQASQSVFRPVGKSREILVSPPLQTGIAPLRSGGPAQNGRGSPRRNGHKDRLSLPLSRFGYFNLHGLADAAEWYGQCDPTAPLDGWANGVRHDYPVALHPQDLEPGSNGSSCRAPQIVFTEACYGAYIQGKGVEEAMALKFLASGSQAVAGATCIAYGAINDPLTAADLLGYAFWKGLGQGLPAGEALRRAKIHLAREMHRRQGYLDGEDQKTLISFVLYGDPLAQPQRNTRGPKTILRPLAPPAQVKTICDRTASENEARPVPPEVMRYVKNVVAQYLPGMADAQVILSQEHASCPGMGHQCPTSQMGAKARPSHEPHRQVVTLQKSVPSAANSEDKIHRHYARLTLDEGGRLVKLVVSR